MRKSRGVPNFPTAATEDQRDTNQSVQYQVQQRGDLGKHLDATDEQASDRRYPDNDQGDVGCLELRMQLSGPFGK